MNFQRAQLPLVEARKGNNHAWDQSLSLRGCRLEDLVTGPANQVQKTPLGLEWPRGLGAFLARFPRNRRFKSAQPHHWSNPHDSLLPRFSCMTRMEGSRKED